MGGGAWFISHLWNQSYELALESLLIRAIIQIEVTWQLRLRKLLEHLQLMV